MESEQDTNTSGQHTQDLVNPPVEEENRFLQAVHQGLADSEAGRLLDDAELIADLEVELQA